MVDGMVPDSWLTSNRLGREIGKRTTLISSKRNIEECGGGESLDYRRYKLAWLPYR